MRRDPYLDALRAGSLAVVVLWHWLGTQLIWRPDGPHATSPLASVPGLWLGTWLLQVMPVFFYVGGCLHRRSYRPRYVPRRALGLLRATAPLLVGWAAVGGLLAVAGGGAWAAGTVTLAHSGLSAWATALHGRGWEYRGNGQRLIAECGAKIKGYRAVFDACGDLKHAASLGQVLTRLR